jgi:hypothetical protein
MHDEVKVKIKFTLEHATKAQGVEVQLYAFFNLGAPEEGNVSNFRNIRLDNKHLFRESSL